MKLPPSELFSVVLGSGNEDCRLMHYFPRGLEGGMETTVTCATWAYESSRMVNLADLYGPVPSRVYFQAGNHTGETITENKYFPMIALPSQILEEEPAFASCLPFSTWSFFDLNKRDKARLVSVWDPPIAVDGTDMIQPPTVTAHTINHINPLNSAAPAEASKSFNGPPKTGPADKTTGLFQSQGYMSPTAPMNGLQTTAGYGKSYVKL